MSDSTGVWLLLLLGAVGLYVYFLPAIIASRRDHPNESAILVLNLLLGWTLIGWVVAIVWACTAIESQGASVETVPLTTNPATRLCPYCAEPIMLAAIKCKHCGSDLLKNPAEFFK